MEWRADSAAAAARLDAEEEWARAWRARKRARRVVVGSEVFGGGVGGSLIASAGCGDGEEGDEGDDMAGGWLASVGSCWRGWVVSSGSEARASLRFFAGGMMNVLFGLVRREGGG